MNRALLALLALLESALVVTAASLNDMEHGPFVSWTIRDEGGASTYKGTAIKTGAGEPAAVCFWRCARYVRRNPEKARLSPREFALFEAPFVKEKLDVERSGGFPAADQPGRLENRPSGE